MMTGKTAIPFSADRKSRKERGVMSQLIKQGRRHRCNHFCAEEDQIMVVFLF